MPTLLTPYIGFKDNAREALQFYHGIFGGNLEISTFADSGLDAQFPEMAQNVMHGMLTAKHGFVLMAADTPASVPREEGSVISISLSGDDEAELRPYFQKLSEGGEITEPLVTAPWGDTFGMLTDKFGIKWMINIAAKKA